MVVVRPRPPPGAAPDADTAPSIQPNRPYLSRVRCAWPDGSGGPGAESGSCQLLTESMETRAKRPRANVSGPYLPRRTMGVKPYAAATVGLEPAPFSDLFGTADDIFNEVLVGERLFSPLPLSPSLSLSLFPFISLLVWG